MSKKKSLIASAVLAGLFSGMALADEATAPVAAEPTVTKVKVKKGGAKTKKKKDEKNACSGPNGCQGMEMPKEETKAK